MAFDPQDFSNYYKWQQKYILHNGPTTLRAGRQSAKSTAAAKRIERLTSDFAPARLLITSPTERQENFLYEKVKAVLGEDYKYKRRPTLKELHLQNGSIIYKYPTGRTGIFVEGLSSIDFIFIDEALNMTERAIEAIEPMMAEPEKVRGLGWMNLLGNTRGRAHGYFYDSHNHPEVMKDFLVMHESSEDCPHISKEFLRKQLIKLGPIKYAQIWKGEFYESDVRYFNKEKVRASVKIKTWHYRRDFSQFRSYFLGIDPAGQGKNMAAFVVIELNGDVVRQIYRESIPQTTLPELMEKSEYLNSLFNFRNIYIDGNGLGVGFVDLMKLKFGSRIVDLNNASKSQDEGGKILKLDLYSNAKRLIETGKAELMDDPVMIESILNVEYDNETGKFFGKNSDEVEAWIRACWCVKQRRYRPTIV